MASYNNINELWYNTLLNLYYNGNELNSRAGKTKEIIGFSAILENPFNNVIIGYPDRKYSLSYACAELLWYLSKTYNIDLIKAYAPSYENFAENNLAYGAYGGRWKYNPGFINENAAMFHPNGDDQLSACIHLLKEKPNTRQAIISMWDSGDIIHAITGSHKDLPCTLSLKFYIREGKLHCIADMRSNDAWLGLPYDIFCFTTLQRIIAEELNLQLGIYVHQAGSMHLYERNFEKTKKILDNYESSYHNIDNRLDNANHYLPLDTMIAKSLNIEKEIRTTKINNYLFNGLTKTFQDLILGCATKWVKINANEFHNSLYRRYV